MCGCLTKMAEIKAQDAIAVKELLALRKSAECTLASQKW